MQRLRVRLRQRLGPEADRAQRGLGDLRRIGGDRGERFGLVADAVGGEQRMLKLTASLADGIPVDLQDTLTGLDDSNIQLLIAVFIDLAARQPTIRLAKASMTKAT